MLKAKELAEKLYAKQTELKEFAGDGKHEKFTTEDIEKFQALNAEVKDIHSQWKAAHEIELALEENEKSMNEFKTPVNRLPNGGSDEQERKKLYTSVGEYFVNSEEYKQQLKYGFTTSSKFDVSVPSTEFKSAEFKTDVTTSAGYAPANNRTNIIILSAQNQPVIQSFIPSSSTSDTAIKYMEETTFTNAMAAKGEVEAAPELAWATTERTVPIEYISGYIPISERQLAAVDGLQSLINDRLMLMWGQKFECYLLGGNGTPPQIRGFYNATNLQTYAKISGETIADALYQGITLVRYTGRAEPDRLAIHPNDWKNIRLMKNSNGDYIWGNPAVAVQEQIWGVPATVTTSATEHSPLVGAFRQYSHISVFESANIQVGRINDDFIKNKLAIKMVGQASLEIYRGQAFCTVTGV